MPEREPSSPYQASLLNIQEAAKQIGAIAPVLQAAYFAAISVSDLKEVVWQSMANSWWLVILFVLPGLFWLLSLFLVIQIFIPPMMTAEIRALTSQQERVINSKYRLLRIAHYILAAGLLILLVNVVVYFLFIPPALNSQSQ